MTESSAPVMRRLGDFILLEEIGRGGMGRVYHAKQVSLDREVALKVLPAAAVLDRDSVIRFKREAEAAGRLSHPGIVPIYAVGQVDDIYFYAMERVEGPSLGELIDRLAGRNPSSLRFSLMEEAEMLVDDSNLRIPAVPDFLSGSIYAASCAALIRELTGALTAAHNGQVIHRDVKPSNILLHSSGRAVLVDFGLARDELQLSMTQTGEAVGTPVYMAPEQAAGSKMLDARVDVYGLGVTLYEMLTLRPPFEGTSAAQVMRAIIEEEPISPRKLNQRVPRALETIVLTCLAKDKENRYASTQKLGEDLTAFLEGHEIRARRTGFGVWFMSRLRRNRRSAWVAFFSILFALVVGVGIGLLSWNNTRQEGLLAMDNAKILLLEGRPREAHAAYVQAQVLLKDPELVAQQRLQSFAEVFPGMYAKHRYEVLDEFLKTLPPEDLDWPEYHEFRRRLHGVGHVAVSSGPVRGVEISIRRIVDGEFDPSWRRLPSDGWLQVGSYLIRLRASGMAPVVRAIEIERDKKMELDPQFKATSGVLAEMALVAPADGEALFAVDRTEVTVSKYAELLQSLNNRTLATELQPIVWNPAAKDRPVVGLSFRQARTVAALLGGHLMSRQEYRYAATCGLRELQYPWGRKFYLDRVVGDPRYTSEPAPVGSKPRGVSPNGIFDLVGNAAEMLSAQRDGNLFVAGGHYASDPRALSVESFSRLPDPDTQSPFVGLRVARFLTVDDDGKANGRVEARIDELARSQKRYVINAWSLDTRGRVDLNQTFVVRTGGQFLDFPELEGFRLSAVLARDSSGNQLRLYDRGAAGGLQLELPKRSGAVRVTVHRRLEAITGLHSRLDSYFFYVPFADRDQASINRVELPVGCRVDEVWPPPDELFYLDGAPVLIWQRSAEIGVREPLRRAAIRFRCDGMLTDSWPALQPTTKFVSKLFATLRKHDSKALSSLLTDDFRFLPQGWTKTEVLRRIDMLPSFADIRVIDATAVGDIVTVELRVTWKHDSGLRVATSRNPWPLRVQLRRTADGLRAVRLMPSTRPDLGIVSGGRYTHRGLRVELAPESGTRMVRLVNGITELQLEVRPPASKLSRGDHWITLAGCVDGTGARDAVRARLSGGAVSWLGGESVSAGAIPPIEITGGERMEHSDEHWLFPRADGGFSREWWTLLSLGHRHFLVRCVATGSTRAEASTRFEARERWFRRLVGTLQVR